MPVQQPVQIALLDDHPLFRQGMRYILHTLPFVESVLETGDFNELLAACRQRLPDVLLLDLNMPGTDGPEAARLLLGEFKELKIVVLSMFSADKFISQMMKLGARSYLPKDVGQPELAHALEEVLTTGYHYTPRMAQAMTRAPQPPARPTLPTSLGVDITFTPRELDVLRLLCEGLSAAEIADRLYVSRRTVEGHRQHLLDKTATANAAGLVAYALRHNLLDN